MHGLCHIRVIKKADMTPLLKKKEMEMRRIEPYQVNIRQFFNDIFILN